MDDSRKDIAAAQMVSYAISSLMHEIEQTREFKTFATWVDDGRFYERLKCTEIGYDDSAIEAAKGLSKEVEADVERVIFILFGNGRTK